MRLARERAGRPWVVRSLGTALLLLAGTLLVWVALVVAGYFKAGQPVGWAVLRVVSGAVTFSVAGLLAWWRRPSNQLGPLMVLGAVAWVVSALGSVQGPVLVGLGVITRIVPFAVVVHLLLVFPSGRLRSGVARWTVVAAYGICLVLQAPSYLWAPDPAAGSLLMISDRPVLVQTGFWVQAVAGWAMMLVTAGILLVRLRRASGRQRRTLGPVYLYGVVAVVVAPLLPDLGRFAGWPPAATNAAALLVLAAAPVVFVVAMFLGGFARAGEIQELGGWLGSAAPSRASLSEALAGALGDPSVRLVFWMADRDCYVDAAGDEVVMPQPGGGRGAVDVRVDGRLAGAIVYDSTLIADPEQVHQASRVIALAVDHQRLTAALAASHREVQRSRLRIVQAGDRERRRIAQNLHDGLQAELVLLAVQAQQLSAAPASPEGVAAAASRLRAGIDRAAAGLRDLVYEVMPAPLVERGLAAATEDLVDRMPVPTRLRIGIDGDLPPAVQSTAYFVVAEGLSNAVKHSGAKRISVELRHVADALVVRVDDDGVGGATLGRGFGLSGLSDRVAVLGGTLRVDSPPGGGTRLTAEVLDAT